MAGRDRSFNSPNPLEEPNKKQRPDDKIACRICDHISMNTKAFIAHISTHDMTAEEISSMRQKHRNLFFQYPIQPTVRPQTSQMLMRPYDPNGYNLSDVPSLKEPGRFRLEPPRVPTTFQTKNNPHNLMAPGRVQPVLFGRNFLGEIRAPKEKFEQSLIDQLELRPAWCTMFQPNDVGEGGKMRDKEIGSELLDLTLKL